MTVCCSGYIPNSVYACSQYRSQHFPTLSTRCGAPRSSSVSSSHRTASSSKSSLNSSILAPPTTINTITYITTTTIVTSEVEGDEDEEDGILSRCDTNKENIKSSIGVSRESLHPRKNSLWDPHVAEIRECLSTSSSFEAGIIEADSLRELSDSLTFALHEKGREKRVTPTRMRQSRSVPRELDPHSLSYEARLSRDPLNLCIDSAALSLEGEELSFPGGLYNLSHQRPNTRSSNHLDSTGSSSCSSPCRSIISGGKHSPSKDTLSSSTFHHPHHHNHLPHLHTNRRHHRAPLHDRSAPSHPPPLLA